MVNSIEQNKDIEFRREKYRVYLEERKTLITGELEGYKSLDKAIFTLSAGSFGITISIFKDSLWSLKYAAFYMLISAWAAFLVSIMSTLISLVLSQYAFGKQKDILDEWYTNSTTGKNIYNSLVKVLNIFSVVIFITGAILIFLMIIFNKK
jgi:hypothetical protein